MIVKRNHTPAWSLGSWKTGMTFHQEGHVWWLPKHSDLKPSVTEADEWAYLDPTWKDSLLQLRLFLADLAWEPEPHFIASWLTRPDFYIKKLEENKAVMLCFCSVCYVSNGEAKLQPCQACDRETPKMMRIVLLSSEWEKILKVDWGLWNISFLVAHQMLRDVEFSVIEKNRFNLSKVFHILRYSLWP